MVKLSRKLDKTQKATVDYILKDIKENMRRINHETEMMMSSMDYNPEYSTRRVPIDVANWSDDPSFKNAWLVQPENGWSHEQITENVHRKPDTATQSTKVLRQFDASDWQDGEVFTQTKRPTFHQENPRPRNGIRFERNLQPIHTTPIEKHPKQRNLYRSKSINDILLQKVNNEEASFLGETYSKSWQRKYTLCHRCNHDVFTTDLITLAGKHFHKWCVKCKQCWITLEDSKRIKQFEGDIFCSRCYGNLISRKSTWIPPFLHKSNTIDEEGTTINPVTRKFFSDTNSIFNRDYLQSNSTFVNRVYSQDELYENRDTILFNSLNKPKRTQMKGILKRSESLPPDLPIGDGSAAKPFIHPLRKNYLQELEQKTIKYDPDEQIPENMPTFLNMKRTHKHTSTDRFAIATQRRQEVGKQYESVLDAARATWIPHYGVPVEQQIDKTDRVEEKVSDFSDSYQHTPIYGTSHITDDKRAEEIKYDYNDDLNNGNDISNQDSYSDNKPLDIKNHITEYELQSELEHSNINLNSRHLDSFQKEEDFISSETVGESFSKQLTLENEAKDISYDNEDEIMLENTTHKNNSERVEEAAEELFSSEYVQQPVEDPDYSEELHQPEREPLYSEVTKVKKKKTKNVSFSSKTTDITRLPTVKQFKVSKANRFYVEKSREKAVDQHEFKQHSQNPEQVKETENAEKVKEITPVEDGLKENELQFDREEQTAHETEVFYDQNVHKSNHLDEIETIPLTNDIEAKPISNGVSHNAYPNSITYLSAVQSEATSSTSNLSYPSHNQRRRSSYIALNGKPVTVTSRNSSIADSRNQRELSPSPYMRYDEMIASRNSEKFGYKPKKKTLLQKIFGKKSKRTFDVNETDNSIRP